MNRWRIRAKKWRDLATKKNLSFLCFFLCVYLPMKSGMPFQWVTSLRDQQCISMQRSYWTFTSLSRCTKLFSNISVWCTDHEAKWIDRSPLIIIHKLMVFEYVVFTNFPADLESFQADTKKEQTKSRCKIFIFSV